ncbi:helix-turn-helix transcriptional regulator [Lactobacillus amylovorus]|uniref:helix-turn-helix transcriptional regulator n=1 Tax=Bacillati TaxID=1783272 RepID=UPI0034440458
MITGQQLREARLRRGWSQGQLADKLGVTERSIGNWERRGIPATQQVRIADVTR